ncbi:uncharacterized protein LOC130717674 isoform X2 [Lotus japonicus]|uniref:uncharacterized protein LOC130717674 isoform X2 n=1 Tax=Lotus japonicus TaxID=34305 RepID=UPI002586434A|nr:uncharacterized protein LOC130717674 isoform X2 [Lotus japonicus]
MPVSGHEETGVKSLAGQFSGFIAGVPIKKRRFPLIQPSSPVSEEETELQRKENSSTSQGSAGAPIKKRRFPSLQASPSPSEEASPPEETDALRKESQGSTLSAGSAGLSDTIENPVFEERKASFDDTKANMEQKANSDDNKTDVVGKTISDDNKADVVGNNSCMVVPKVEEPVLETQPCTLDIVNSIEKVKVIQNEGDNKEMESQMIKGNPELLLAAKEGLLALSIGADVSKQNAQDLSKQESHVPESSSLSLSLKEHLFPAVASPEVEDSHTKIEKIEKVEPVSLELSLSKEECSPHRVNTDTKTSGDITKSHSNRANWDLNTTMDAWEEFGSHAGSVKTSSDGMKMMGTALGEKLLTSDRKPLRTAESLKKNTLEEQNKASLSSRIQKNAEGPSRFSVKLNPGSVSPAVSLSNVVATAGDASTSSFRSVLSSYLQKNAEEPSRFPVKLNPGSAIPAVSLSNVVATVGDASTSSFRSVKPEPLDNVAIKQEFLISKSSEVSHLKLVDPMFIKSEPQERSKTAESSTDQFGKELPQGSDNCSSTMPMPMPMPVLLKVPQISADGAHSPPTVHLETVVTPMVDNGTVLSDPSSKISSILTKDAADHEGCRLKLMNEPPPDPRDSGESCVNDEEKITLSEDDSYDSDFESDDNHAITVGADTQQHVEDDDYEDGEVREPLDPSTVEETICEVREVEHPDSSNYENQQVEKEVVSVIVDHVAEIDNKTGIHREINSVEDGVDIHMVERLGNVVDKNMCVQESFDDDNSNIAFDDDNSNIATDRRSIDEDLQRELSDVSERKIFSEETELPFDQPNIGSHGVDVVQCAEEVIKTTDTVLENDINFPKTEGSANTDDDSARDFNNGGNQGRIIDLSRAASSSSPSKTRPIPGRSLSSRPGRDVLPDTLDGEKFHRGRDEVYVDSPHKFSRERHQDMSGRNSRMNFVRGRGRMNSRMDSHRGEWDSDREYSGEFYNGPTQYRGPRPKYASAMADTDMEYNNAPDGSYASNARLGRKPLNDGSYIAPRRRSPGGRDGIQMGHRNPRPISPNRCMGGDGSELVGVRHNEKFMRGYPDDTMDPVYSRPQQFEAMESRFSRGGRNFSSMQRRGPPQIRSKSPIRSRSRSPPWSSPRRRSPRRRSPEGFGNHPDCSHRRSPMYRVDRMRSPPVFSGERVVRRHDSPSFMSRPSNDMRDIDSARDHGHPRPGISNRSPSGRILIRNNRRFDVVDHRDRADNDTDYFGGPMHSGGRMLELNGEANGEERRRFGERRGPVRTFRPPYNNNVGENFHINAEDGPRQHYRFCSDDSDFHDRGNNMRERDFDRRIKGGRGPANVPPRRTRNMDEQEENFRHGGQVWNDDSFDDISRVKRKRF